MIGASASSSYEQHSLVRAKVTKAYEKLGCVKVRTPWMKKKDEESDWIAVVAPMAGKERGLFLMPEEGDEVLVAYSQSHSGHSYVVGFLWSKDNKPPESERAKRCIKSVSGHTILLDDTKDAERISIVDKSGKNKIVLDAKNNTITIESDGDLQIKSKGSLILESSKALELKGNDITIKAKQKVAVEGQELALDGPAGVKINDGALEVT